MRTLLLLTGLMLVTACSLDPTKKAFNDPGEALEKLDGPKVEGMSATLERSAEDSLEKGEPRRAAQFYKQLYDMPKIDEKTKNSYAIGLAESMRRGGEISGSMKYLQEVLKKDPDNVEALEGMGLTLLADGKSVEAGRTFEKVMKIDATRWRTLNALGILFTTKNMLPEANAYFTEALKYSADNPTVLNNVGLTYATERKFDKAVEAFEQASRFANGNTQRKRQIDLNMAMVYGIAGDYDRAKDIASRYLKGPALDNNLGLYAHLANNDDLARAYLNTALSGSPTHYERAWKNLEIVTEESKGGNAPSKAKSVKVTQ